MRRHVISIFASVLFLVPVFCTPASFSIQLAGDPSAGVQATGPVTTATATSTSPVDVHYASLADLESRLHDLAGRHAGLIRPSSLGETSQRNPLWALELAGQGERPPVTRPAILVVAGLNAMQRAGPTVAIGLVEYLAANATANPQSDAGKLLGTHTVYILPCMNPDRYVRLQSEPAEPVGTNLRPVDDDRDDRIDEDPPEDLNGDGQITMMRVKGREPTHIADPEEARLVRQADAVKGEVAVYELYSEGIDNDADGAYNEDGSGGVSLDANFPHLYRPNRPDSGPHQISETETRALAEFVLQHPNIAAVIVPGAHDNLVSPPAGRDRDATGQSYRDLHPDDVASFGELAKQFRDTTGLKGAAAVGIEGAFHAWCYNQRGIPSFATSLWWPLEEKPAASQPATQSASQPTTQPGATQPAGTQPAATQATPAEIAPGQSEQTPAQPEAPPSGDRPRRRGRFGQRGGEAGPPGAGPPGPEAGRGAPGGRRPAGAAEAPPREPEKPKENPTEDKKWLAYSDKERGGAGFVAWTPFKHPTLGDVEIGGFVPGFRLNPPEGDLTGIVEKQATFLISLAGKLPRIEVVNTQVKSPGAGVYDIEFQVMNSGYLPSANAMARTARRDRPIIIRPGFAPERILGGPRMHRIEWLAGSGGRQKVRWLVSGPEGERITFKIFHEPIGEFEHVVELRPTEAAK